MQGLKSGADKPGYADLGAVDLTGPAGDWSGGTMPAVTDIGSYTAKDLMAVNQDGANAGGATQASAVGLGTGLGWGDYQKTLDAVVAQGLLPKTAMEQSRSRGGMSYTAPAGDSPKLGKSKSL